MKFINLFLVELLLVGSVMKIVSLSPAITEILVLLGAEDEIVGVTPFCFMWLRDKKEIIGSYLHVRFDRLEKLKPDIVFLQSHVHDKFYEIVKSRGFNAYLTPLPSSLYGILQNVLDVGSLIGRYYEARELVSRIVLEKLSRLRDILSKPLSSRVRVYVEYLWPDWSYSTAGALTFIDDGLWWSGGLNIFYDRPAKFFTPKREEVGLRDPEVVLVNIEPQMEVSMREYLNRRWTGELEAARSDRVFLVRESKNINLAHMGPSFIDTVMWISMLLKRVSKQ